LTVRKILIQTEENLLNDDISLLTKIDPLPLIEFDPIYKEVSEFENSGEKQEGPKIRNHCGKSRFRL